MAGRFAPVGKLAPANALCKPDDNPWKAPKSIIRRSKVILRSFLGHHSLVEDAN